MAVTGPGGSLPEQEEGPLKVPTEKEKKVTDKIAQGKQGLADPALGEELTKILTQTQPPVSTSATKPPTRPPPPIPSSSTPPNRPPPPIPSSSTPPNRPPPPIPSSSVDVTKILKEKPTLKESLKIPFKEVAKFFQMVATAIKSIAPSSLSKQQSLSVKDVYSQLPSQKLLAFKGDKLEWVDPTMKGVKFIDLNNYQINVKYKEPSKSKENGYFITIKDREYKIPELDNGGGLFNQKVGFEKKVDEPAFPNNFKIEFGMSSPEVLDTELKEKELEFVSDPEQLFIHSSENETVILQAKGYIHPGEKCADVVALDHVGNVSMAIVTDASGNKPESRMSAQEATNQARKTFMTQLHKETQGGQVSKEVLKKILWNTIVNTQISLPQLTDLKPCTMVFTVELMGEDGKKYICGFCMGDAKALLKKSDGAVQDLGVSEFDKPYADSGGAFGSSRNKFVPIFEQVNSGDMLILGSDGLGDNLEAKSLAKTPLDAIKDLKEANWLPKDLEYLENDEKIKEIKTASGWTEEKFEGKIKDDLQKLHDLYIKHMTGALCAEPEAKGVAASLHKHCTQTDLIKVGIFINNMGDELAKHPQQSPKRKEVHENHLEDYKTMAKLYMTHLAEGQQQEIFKAWDSDPEQGYNYLGERMGKPDDFSLIIRKIT